VYARYVWRVAHPNFLLVVRLYVCVRLSVDRITWSVTSPSSWRWRRAGWSKGDTVVHHPPRRPVAPAWLAVSQGDVSSAGDVAGWTASTRRACSSSSKDIIWRAAAAEHTATSARGMVVINSRRPAAAATSTAGRPASTGPSHRLAAAAAAAATQTLEHWL